MIFNPQSAVTPPAPQKAGFLMQRSPEAQAYHRWYKLKLWCHKPTGLRWQCLVKALFKCQQPGCGWQAKASETHKLHADHIIPHRGDWELFRDPDNLQCLCETCSNAAKQSLERRGYSIALNADGWPIDPKHPANAGGGVGIAQ
jgi:5-methylcytosine-specific restriction protein A